jgi:enamine deaminase RidA (YjgF/YER057c/UK114 family)
MPGRPMEDAMKKVIVPPAFASYPAEWHFSPGLDTGDFVFFSGVTGVRPDLSLAEDPQTQFRETFEFLKAHLIEAGLAFADIVEMTTYHVDLRRHWDKFFKVKDEFVAEPYPAWTAVGVSELITPGTLVEIRAIARRR